ANAAGRLDVMVNCAGVIGPNNHKITEVEMVEYDATLAVNLRGSYLMTKYALVEMEKRNYGRVLLIASIAGKEGNAKMSPYSISKAGVIGLVKAVGKEYAETGITVNALAPAAIYTSMLENAEPEAVQYMMERIPMRRFGKLEELAATAAWIVSAEASFNTGFAFDMSGGRATF
ncbi:MAG: SDR family oxidoreductase, partial [Candidatus Latescibacteria bacterium]|nr:SDR family oxidoreductase [Candidatus Latescibacterota bacterium]